MRFKAIAAVTASAALLAAAPALAHEGGHKGGCEEFGQINHDIGKDPAAFGFPGARNLGDLVSSFAKASDAQPGVGDIVEQIDHAACG
jgi:hypothetical protein